MAHCVDRCEAGAAGGRRPPGNIDIVLHRKGDAVEREPAKITIDCVQP
jgi:hypothetical protein